MEECLCETCAYGERDHNKRPCSVCMQWVDGYLDATQYENRAIFNDFYESWEFLNNHKIYNGSYGINCFQNRCLDIDVVKVNPISNAIENDRSLNTKIQVWLESGEYSDEYKQGCHDIDLDCGADTFEEAIIKLANLVYEKFGGNS